MVTIMSRATERRNMHPARLARLRQLAYILLSLLICYPDERRRRAIAMTTAILRESSIEMLRFAFFPQWQRLLDAIADMDCCPPLGLEEEHIRIFMHNAERAPCLPYESVYVDPEGWTAGWVVAQVEEEYAAAGLSLSPSAKERPDHGAVELQFMGFLCEQEACAWDAGDRQEAARALRRQAGFLDRHLLRWFPEWAGQVIVLSDGGTYSLVGEAAHSFVSHDRDLISILLERVQRTCGLVQAGNRRGH